jgi:hypothetical protein
MRNLLLFLLFAVGTLAVAEVAAIVTTTSPYNASESVLSTFYISVFVGSTATLTLLWYWFKKYVVYHYSKTPGLAATLRQAGLFSGIVVLCLFFNSLNILSAWEIIPLLLSAILIEFFFQADKSTISSGTV